MVQGLQLSEAESRHGCEEQDPEVAAPLLGSAGGGACTPSRPSTPPAPQPAHLGDAGAVTRVVAGVVEQQCTPADTIQTGQKAQHGVASDPGPHQATPDAQKGGEQQPSSSTRAWLLPVLYGGINLAAVIMIVFANKVVLFTLNFRFAVTLTWLHCAFTATGMTAMAAAGVFEAKRVPLQRSLPVACVYVGFIVLNNLSIQLNTVGFYQISKITITPVVVLLEYLVYGKRASHLVLCSIVVLLLGVTMSTLTDSQVSSNPLGVAVAAANVLVSALYQVWAGSKQKELGLSANQLLHQVAPSAVALLAIMVPAFEPIGFDGAAPGTVLGYTFTPRAVAWILVSSSLGLVVTLSSFLFIGVTSSLTYNVVGYLKTVAIVTGGVLFFGDEMTWRKAGGLAFTMSGIAWYTHIKMVEAGAASAQ